MEVNDVVCHLRLVNKTAAAVFRGQQQFTTVRLSQPVPPNDFALKWAVPAATKSLTRRQRLRLLSLTASSGSIPNLEVALEVCGCMLRAEVLAAAASAGHLDVCRLLLRHGCPTADHLGTCALSAAARSGQRAACELLLGSGVAWSAYAVSAAIRGGHMDLAEWLILQGPAKDSPQVSHRRASLTRGGITDIIATTAEACTLAELQSMYQRLLGDKVAWKWKAIDLYRLLSGAVCSSTPDWRAKVEWLESVQQPMPVVDYGDGPDVFTAAATAGADAVDRMKWLLQRGYVVDPELVSGSLGSVVDSGNLAALEFLLDQGARLSASTAVAAARGGMLDVLRLHLQGGVPLDAERIANAAAGRGNTAVLTWVQQELGKPLSRLTSLMGAAAETGSVALMAWLRDRGCRWHGAFTAAARSGCEEALEWLEAQGCPMGNDGWPYVRAAEQGDLSALRCLSRLGCPWGCTGEVLKLSLTMGPEELPLAVLRCMVEEGCPVDWEAAVRDADEFSGCVSPAVRTWLEQQRPRQQPPPPSQERQRQARQDRAERRERRRQANAAPLG